MAESSITGAHVRMARAFLRWSIADLAERAEIGISTVQAIEKLDGSPAIEGGLDATLQYRAGARAQAIAAIAKTLRRAGITILPDDGAAGIGIRGKIEARKRAARG